MHSATNQEVYIYPTLFQVWDICIKVFKFKRRAGLGYTVHGKYLAGENHAGKSYWQEKI